MVGSGGREHALAWRLEQSPKVSKVYVAPGNGGTRNNIDIPTDDIQSLAEFAESESAFTVVGPEVPLAAGIADEFTKRHLAIFGPTKAAAQLESSKSWSKDFMMRHNIPTAKYKSFDDAKNATEYAETFDGPLVVKADGLAAGKGVTVCKNAEHAKSEIVQFMQTVGARVVIEEALTGAEASFIALCDGKRAMPMASSQDHKRAGDGDTGPNTGGMGTYSPTKFVTEEIAARVQKEVIESTVEGMCKEGIPFCGFLYAGLMIGQDDRINVLEFNARMGDPECQPIMMRADFDLYEYLESASKGELDTMEPMKWSADHAACVVLASKDYPRSYPKGQEIVGIGQDSADSVVFHAGTRMQENNIVTNGGRVLGVTARGPTLKKALSIAYDRADAISWDAKFCRRDIGLSGL